MFVARLVALCLLLGLSLGAATAAAQSQIALPGYDTERFCTWAALSQVAVKPDADAGAIRQGCRVRETTALDALNTLWPDMPDQARNWCSGQIDNAIDQVSAPTGSYELLYECILDQTVGFVPSWN